MYDDILYVIHIVCYHTYILYVIIHIGILDENVTCACVLYTPIAYLLYCRLDTEVVNDIGLSILCFISQDSKNKTAVPLYV